MDPSIKMVNEYLSDVRSESSSTNRLESIN